MACIKISHLPTHTHTHTHTQIHTCTQWKEGISLYWQLSMTVRIRDIAIDICEGTDIYKRNQHPTWLLAVLDFMVPTS